jgi:hypothetical protein
MTASGIRINLAVVNEELARLGQEAEMAKGAANSSFAVVAIQLSYGPRRCLAPATTARLYAVAGCAGDAFDAYLVRARLRRHGV